MGRIACDYGERADPDVVLGNSAPAIAEAGGFRSEKARTRLSPVDLLVRRLDSLSDVGPPA